MGKETASLIVAGGKTALDVYGAYREGKRAEEAARFEAKQLELEAGQVKAAAGARGREVERQGALAASRALAIAASQGGASDPTVMSIISNLAGETHYRKMVEIYQGEEESKQLLSQAKMTRKYGREARKAARYKMAQSAISGATSLFEKYGKMT